MQEQGDPVECKLGKGTPPEFIPPGQHTPPVAVEARGFAALVPTAETQFIERNTRLSFLSFGPGDQWSATNPIPETYTTNLNLIQGVKSVLLVGDQVLTHARILMVQRKMGGHLCSEDHTEGKMDRNTETRREGTKKPNQRSDHLALDVICLGQDL